MTLLYILFFIIIFICAVMLLPLKLVVAYDKTQSVAVKLLFFKKELITKKDEDEKETAKPQRKAKKNTKKSSEKPKEQQKKLTAADIIKLLKDVIKPLTTKFFGYLRIDHYDIKVVIASEDAAATALLYGAASAMLFSLLSVIETIKPSRRSISGKNKSNAQIKPDFLATQPSLNAHIVFSLRVWQFIYCALRGSRELLVFNKSRKT